MYNITNTINYLHTIFSIYALYICMYVQYYLSNTAKLHKIPSRNKILIPRITFLNEKKKKIREGWWFFYFKEVINNFGD